MTVGDTQVAFQLGANVMAMKRYKTVDEFLMDTETWKEELARLREILHSTDLEEAVKWSMPCYTYKEKNIVGIGAFQGHFGLWFFQGALLDDPKKRLVDAQDGRTKAMRQWRMTSRREIRVGEIKGFIAQAMRHVDEGKAIKADRGQALSIPLELEERLGNSPRLQSSFEALTLGRQREYANYVSEAKREETRRKRVEKIEPMILSGIGLNDKYRKC